MKTIAEIQQILQELSRDMEQLKETEKKTAVEGDFSAFSAVAKRYPITLHPLKETDMHIRKRYLTVLLSIVPYDTEAIDNSLLLIHRIAHGAGYLAAGNDLREEYIAAQTLTFAQIDEITDLLQEEELRLMLILKLLLLAGGFEKGRADALAYIAQLCTLLKVDKQKLTFLSNMAAVILTGDLKQYTCKIQNTYDKLFSAYLKTIAFQRELLYLPEIPYRDDREVSIEGIAFELAEDELICECKYGSVIIKARSEEFRRKLHGRAILLRTSIWNRGERHGFIDEKKLAELLKRPVGVITHELDSPQDAQDWYTEHGGVVNEKSYNWLENLL